MGKPSFNVRFGAFEGGEEGASGLANREASVLVSFSPASWYDWMDGRKLRHLLHPLPFTTLFEATLDNEAWLWIDLLRVG
jgi:hypothetical protein